MHVLKLALHASNSWQVWFFFSGRMILIPPKCIFCCFMNSTRHHHFWQEKYLPLKPSRALDLQNPTPQTVSKPNGMYFRQNYFPLHCCCTRFIGSWKYCREMKMASWKRNTGGYKEGWFFLFFIMMLRDQESSGNVDTSVLMVLLPWRGHVFK